MQARCCRLRTWVCEDCHHRSLRTGLTEVVNARGKTPAQVTEIIRGMLRAQGLAQHSGEACRPPRYSPSRVSVVKIDNGFGAGCLASAINRA
jgi:NCAIR mutase (PurE)-related protein